MNLRRQEKSNLGLEKSPWTLEQIEAGLKKFFEENGRYPTATEIDQYEYLPSTRTLERSFGGLVGVREKLKLGKEFDFRKGSHSSKRAYTINERSNRLEAQVYAYLKVKFGQEFVHREYLFTDDARTRADFFVYDNNKGFCVDVFYPSSLRNLALCVNSKLNKYNGTAELLRFPVIFLQMNDSIKGEEIARMVKRKKESIPNNYIIMGWEDFDRFCVSRKAIRALYD